MKLTTISAILSLMFLGNIIWIYKPGVSLFSYHPPFMVAAQILLIHSIALFTQISRKWRLTVHWVLAGLGVMFFLMGFLAIYTNKNNFSKPHFSTWHGLIGVFTIACLIMQMVGGISAKYKAGCLLEYKLLKKAHRWNGIVSIFLSLFTVSLVIKVESGLFYLYVLMLVFPSLLILARIASKLLGLYSNDITKKSVSK